MNTRRFIIFTACAVTVAAVLLAWRSARSAAQAEASLLALTPKRASATAEIRRWEERLATSETERTRLQARTNEAKKTPALPMAASSPKPVAAPSTLMETLMEDPRLQTMFLTSQRASLATRYGPLFRQLMLTPEQRTRFEEIMIRRTAHEMDLRAAAQAQGLAPNSPALAALRQEAQDEAVAAQLQLLGPAGLEQWRQYDRADGVRATVQSLAGAAVLEAMPLTAQQAEQLTQILANASGKYRAGEKADPSDIDWSVVDRKAAAVLSEGQLKLFQQVEPIGGGASRFGARLNDTFAKAVKADRANDRAPASPPPGG